jgi:hypothetical protein
MLIARQGDLVTKSLCNRKLAINSEAEKWPLVL